MSDIGNLFHIEYEGGTKPIIDAPGIFSFTLYDKYGMLDLKTTYLTTKIDVYFVGVLSYLKMVNTEAAWRGWRVVIHTTPESVEKNPLTFNYFRELGAIIGITRLREDYNSKYFAFIRAARYFPMFISNNTIAIRDADTIFDKYIERMIQKSTDITNFESKKIAYNTGDFDEFTKALSHWEQVYAERTREFTDAVVFSYDSNYYFINSKKKINNNNSKKNINSLVWTGTNSDYTTSYMIRARFLAGMLTKYGPALPMKLWTSDLIEYIPKFIKYHNNADLKFHLMDEYYLTNIIYKWCKENNRVAFFKINYVSPDYMSFAKSHFKNRNETTNKNWEKRERPFMKMYNQGGLLPASFNPNVHSFTLFDPESYHLKPEFFNNPLKYGKKVSNMKVNSKPITSWSFPTAAPIGPLKKPDWMPSYFFGGKYSRKRKNNFNKTRKYRKHKQ
jgi:hypothetical protein